MSAIVFESDSKYEVAVHNQTVLEAIREAKLDFPAPCGGNGTCGKCQVLIRDGEGVRYALACRTQLTEGMEVHIESRKPMSIQETGTGSAYEVDEGQEGYGLAIDIGTTTVVCRLHDLATGDILALSSRVNPQGIYGADVIARISASMEGHLGDMCDLIRGALDQMVSDMCRKLRIDRASVNHAAIVGNTVIQHIAAGLPPDRIGVSPFEPVSYFGEEIPFEPVCGKAYFAPVVSGYIGGDITAGIMASGMDNAEQTQIYLDLGTNGELAMGSRRRMTSCATAAGPVFEGAIIHFGMPAQPGAISSVTVDGNTLGLSVLGDVDPIGICGTGLIEAVAAMLDIGVVDETGRLLDAGEVDPRWSARCGKHEDRTVFYLDEGHTIFITQGDIRNVQLAKSAVCAGILTLLQDHGVAFSEIDKLIVAGGFGSFLNIEASARIGLFPAEFKNRAESVGNMAAEGASMLLLSERARESTHSISAHCEYIELSTSAEFNNLYMECMMFEA